MNCCLQSQLKLFVPVPMPFSSMWLVLDTVPSQSTYSSYSILAPTPFFHKTSGPSAQRDDLLSYSLFLSPDGVFLILALLLLYITFVKYNWECQFADPGATFEPSVEACLAWFYFRDRHILPPHRIGAFAAAQTEWRDRRTLARRRARCLPAKVHLSFQCRRKSQSQSQSSRP